jgi:hypothetical protein
MNTDNWKWFRYDEIFEIRKGKRLTKADMEKGEIPFIGATDSYNGITAKVGNQKYIHPGNTITVSYNGSIAEAFYQPKSYWACDDVNVLYPKFELNDCIAFFIITLIGIEKYRFNYGRKWDKELMEESKIKLPTMKDENPDWHWIETYVKNSLIPQLPQKAKSIWDNSFNYRPILNEKFELKTKGWKWFRYDDIFHIRKGFYNKKPDENSNGEIPFIGATDSNNGITSFHNIETIEKSSKTGEEPNASIKEKIFDSNCITVSNNGSIGYAFYQPKPFTCTHDVNPLYLKSYTLNKFIALFLCTIIELERYRWAYGRKWRPARMPKSKIKLPVTSNGNPDWQFMEDYIKSLPYCANL